MAYQTILLIDDDEDDQEVFITALESLETRVECRIFSNAKDALEQLVKKKIETQLIFLDLNMPVMNGQQFLVEIKKNNDLKGIPIIILSTSAHQVTKNLMLDLGAQDFITKPNEFGELISTLRKVLN